ncbi:MAG: valyl-tRNA synthetase [Parcubacteria group bacterium Gr01-1014_20]|nr:MAG: valyl-tRNA synthetase [Parcubacteria group bacterium Gr01-1014_20]
MLKDLEPRYEHNQVEEKIYRLWEESGFFDPDKLPDAKKRKSFTIVMPPNNANGLLHMGHAVGLTLQDILIRFWRMRGRKTLWLPGADHAGFETQVVYDKKLDKEGRNRYEISREQLWKEIWDFTEENKAKMYEQTKKLGASCDWSRETALSDLEVKHVEREDPLYFIKYGPLTLATVRPETKFGDTALAVNPKDPRYKKYIGNEIEAKGILGTLKFKVIGDEAVDPKFGTGVVKVTPAHDSKWLKRERRWWKR